MIYTLFHKNIPVLTFEYASYHYPFLKIESIINEKHIPLGINMNSSSNICSFLNMWWETRLVPSPRCHDPTVLPRLANLYNISYGANLSDHYWIKPIDSSKKWEDINFFTNAFTTHVGEYILNDGFMELEENPSLSPDLFTNGDIGKRWIIDSSNNRLLLKYSTHPYKSEPFNEVLASEICRRLNFYYVPYDVEIKDNEPYSVCKTFTDENTEYIPSFFIQFAMKKNNNTSYFDHLLNCCRSLNMQNIEDIETKLCQMILLDFLIANGDRHWGNFGFIRHAETLSWLGTAPLFDSGNSLFYIYSTRDLERSKGIFDNVKSKSFKSTQTKQLKMVKDKIKAMNISFDFLHDIGSFFEQLYSKHPNIESERIKLLKTVLLKRIDEAKEIIYS